MEERDDDLDRELMPPQFPHIEEGQSFSPPLIKLEENNKIQPIDIVDAGEM